MPGTNTTRATTAAASVTAAPPASQPDHPERRDAAFRFTRGPAEPSRHAVIEVVGEDRIHGGPIVGEQQRKLRQLGVLRVDSLTGQRRVDRVQRRSDLGVHRGVVKQSHCRPS